MRERQPKKVYWGVMSEGIARLEAYDSREAAEHDARWEIRVNGADWSHVVRLTTEVVKTLRRKS